tara:strand:- start:157 stop:273 length:117 start_codon:yes stop_codon:yes gene_type:complete
MENIDKLKKVLKHATDERLIKHLKHKISILENNKTILK